MQTLTAVTHAHHDRLRAHVEELRELGDCLDTDCLDTSRLTEGLPRLRAMEEALTGELLPHMEAVEAAVYPTLERLTEGRDTSVPMRHEHEEIRRLVAAFSQFVEHPEPADRAAVLSLRRVVLRLYLLLKAHLAEEELYLPILEGKLTPGQEAALVRALDHLAAERL